MLIIIMTTGPGDVGVYFNNFSVRSCIFFFLYFIEDCSLLMLTLLLLWPWHILTMIVTITLSIHCPYENRHWLCEMSQVFTFCLLTYCNLLIRNPSTSPPCNGGFWPAEFKPFCLCSWCFLAWLSETSCLFDALSIHANVPLDNASQLIHSFY